MSLRQLRVRISKRGNFHANYKDCRIVVKLTKKGYYSGKIYRRELSCKLVNYSNIRTMFIMALNHIDENY